MRKTIPATIATACAAFLLTSCGSDSNDVARDDDPQTPNILFVIMDDVGIDQMKSFGYGGVLAPRMPVIDAVGTAGVRFHNTWSMPECSPGRAAFFAGRYPHRTEIRQAIGPQDLANSQLSPYEVTTPQLLKKADYESAMFGKFHLAGPDNNEAGNATPSLFGWDYFYGWVEGLPGSIDTTAGGIVADELYTCGFVPRKQFANGADTGACYQPDNRCTQITAVLPTDSAPGLQCLDSGGIFVPDTTCGTPPASLDFERENAYYVSHLVINDGGAVEEVPLTDSRARGYRTRIETDAAIKWIKARPSNKPWMATVSYTSAHTPWQQPPASLLSGNATASDAWSCTDVPEGRRIQNKMTEALDTEFGRLLVETGLAAWGDQGQLIYDPQATNTIIAIVGDNGSLATAVKVPFEASQAKGTAYQTGVWVPLIIAGPQVVQPGREVGHMVNAVDLFELFGEVAQVDVHKEVPRAVDSVGILPYLTSPDQASLRTINFTLGGVNMQADGDRNGPCLISSETGSSCTQVPTEKSVCEDNLGEWWGPNYTSDNVVDNGGAGYKICAEVNQALYKAQRPIVNITPETSMAIRNDNYKLVRNYTQYYDSITDTVDQLIKTEELYEINEDQPVPLLDTPDRNLLLNPNPGTQAIYDDLLVKLETVLASEPDCPGDGNKDGVVDGEDLKNWTRIVHDWGKSSVYDFNLDGLTDNLDEAIIQNNLGKVCEKSYAIY